MGEKVPDIFDIVGASLEQNKASGGNKSKPRRASPPPVPVEARTKAPVTRLPEAKTARTETTGNKSGVQKVVGRLVKGSAFALGLYAGHTVAQPGNAIDTVMDPIAFHNVPPISEETEQPALPPAGKPKEKATPKMVRIDTSEKARVRNEKFMRQAEVSIQELDKLASDIDAVIHDLKCTITPDSEYGGNSFTVKKFRASRESGGVVIEVNISADKELVGTVSPDSNGAWEYIEHPDVSAKTHISELHQLRAVIAKQMRERYRGNVESNE